MATPCGAQNPTSRTRKYLSALRCLLPTKGAAPPRATRARLQTLNGTQTSAAQTKPVVASAEAEEQAQA